MGFVEVLTAILQNLFVSFGMGASTVAFFNFFKAIADGVIDEWEHNFMDIAYYVLRTAMVGIFATLLILGFIDYEAYGFSYFSPFILAVWTTLIILYLNAFLMTLHVMPSTFGPAIQVASWYTLGMMFALVPLGLTNFTYLQYAISYLCAILIAVAIANATMAYLRHDQNNVDS